MLGAGTIVTADDNSTLTGLDPELDRRRPAHHRPRNHLYRLLRRHRGHPRCDRHLEHQHRVGAPASHANCGVRWSLERRQPGDEFAAPSTIGRYSDYEFTGNGAARSRARGVFGRYRTADRCRPAPQRVIRSGRTAMTPFGSAPPDLCAVAVNNETSVQMAGGQVGGGASTAPVTGLAASAARCAIRPACRSFGRAARDRHAVHGYLPGRGSPSTSIPSSSTAVIRIGPESIDMKSLPASPRIVPTALPVTATFAPRYSWGNPLLPRPSRRPSPPRPRPSTSRPASISSPTRRRRS